MNKSIGGKLRIMLVHQNFPGQFRELAPALVKAGHDVLALSMKPDPLLPGIQHVGYRPERSSTRQIHPWLINTETAVIRGEEVAKQVDNIVHKGWCPDVVLGHTGWGEMLFMRQALPEARLIGFHELYYQETGGDIGFDPEVPGDPLAGRRLHARNMHLLTSLLDCDVGITPTHWQASCFPPSVRGRLEVLHDGIRTDMLLPDEQATVMLPGTQLTLRAGDEVLTFVNRNLEPMRGYHQFMRALPEVLRRRPRVQVVIVGGEGVSYSAKTSKDGGYKKTYLDEVRHELDMSRVHFVGRLPYPLLMNLLKVSAVHVYLTAPFVLSWSMLEAMSLGAMVVGSDTEPVREVIQDGHNGRLVDFFNPRQLADAVCDVLAQPGLYRPMRKAARQTVVERYDFLKHSLPRYLELLLRD